MSPFLSWLASTVLLTLGIWLLGGLLLRLGGATLAIGGLLATIAIGSLSFAQIAVFGVLAWHAGHWLFAARHHYFDSPLARRIFNDALPELNPTRRWGNPNVPPEQRRRANRR